MESTADSVAIENVHSEEISTELAGLALDDTESIKLASNAFLERLPQELLLVVFDWIRIICNIERIRLSLVPLSKSLLFSHRQILYHSARVETDYFFDFCGTVERHSLQSAVSELHIVCSGDVEPDWKPHEDRLFRFLRSMINVKDLGCYMLRNLPLLVLSPRFATAVLPNLRSIIVPHDRRNLVESLRFRRCYRKLERLVLIVLQGPLSEDPAWVMGRCEEEDIPLPLDRVERLDIHVTRVGYRSFTHTIDLDALLKRLPPQLRHLEIDATKFWGATTSIIPSLPFPQLESFISSGGFITPEILSSLHRLPLLQHVELDHSDLIAEFTPSFLAGPTKLPALRKFRIFESLAERIVWGKSYRDEGHVFGLTLALYQGTLTFAPDGWTTPEWTRAFGGVEQARNHLALMKELGLEDPGCAIADCVENQEDYDIEVEQCRIHSETAEGMEAIAQMRRDGVQFRNAAVEL